MFFEQWYEELLSRDAIFQPDKCRWVEMWQLESGDVTHHAGTLELNEIEEWVSAKNTRPWNSRGGLRCLIGPAQNRLLWPPSPFSSRVLRRVFEEFSLTPTFLYTCSTGNRVMVSCGSELDDGPLSWTFRSVHYAGAFSYSNNTALGIVTAGADNADIFIDKLRVFSTHACHPMFIPTTVAVLELARLNRKRDGCNADTRELEHRTGLRANQRTDDEFIQDAGNSLRQALEGITKIALYEADCDLLGTNLIDPIVRSKEWIDKQLLSSQDADGKARMKRQMRELDYLLQYLSQSTKSIRRNLASCLKRSECQVSGLYSLLAQRDNSLNLEMARVSRRLASASKRDSSSMKTVAILTTIFLPGTFMATVLGMPMIDFKPTQFWIYLAISIPLTIVTLAIWAAWMAREKTRNENLDKEAEQLQRQVMYASRYSTKEF